MPRMCVPDRCNRTRMPRRRQPVAHHRRNCASALATSPVVHPRFAGDQQHHLHALRNRLLQCAVEPRIGAGQSRTVKVNADIGNNCTLVDAPVPLSVEIVRFWQYLPFAASEDERPIRCTCLWGVSTSLDTNGFKGFRRWFGNNLNLGLHRMYRRYRRNHPAPKRLFLFTQSPRHPVILKPEPFNRRLGQEN